jgi:hypothetical protein
LFFGIAYKTRISEAIIVFRKGVEVRENVAAQRAQRPTVATCRTIVTAVGLTSSRSLGNLFMGWVGLVYSLMV